MPDNDIEAQEFQNEHQGMNVPLLLDDQPKQEPGPFVHIENCVFAPLLCSSNFVKYGFCGDFYGRVFTVYLLIAGRGCGMDKRPQVYPRAIAPWV